MLTPSIRLVYTSRASRSPIADGVCRCSRGVLRCGVLGRVRGGCVSHPGPVLVCLEVMRHALPVARTVTAHHPAQLFEVRLAEIVVSAVLVPAQLRIGWCEIEHDCLRRDHVDEALTQLVVRKTLDPPRHRLRAVR